GGRSVRTMILLGTFRCDRHRIQQQREDAMTALPKTAKRALFEPAKEELVQRARAGDPAAIRTIIRRYNQRLYRLARAIVRSDTVAEDVLQESYLKAFAALGSFRGEASLSTWLSRIVVNEALGRLRQQRRQKKLHGTFTTTQHADVISFPLALSADDPERTMAQRQLLQLVEQACDDLPDIYRVVFVARVIEGLSVAETAAALELQ